MYMEYGMDRANHTHGIHIHITYHTDANTV